MFVWSQTLRLIRTLYESGTTGVFVCMRLQWAESARRFGFHSLKVIRGELLFSGLAPDLLLMDRPPNFQFLWVHSGGRSQSAQSATTPTPQPVILLWEKMDVRVSSKIQTANVSQIDTAGIDSALYKPTNISLRKRDSSTKQQKSVLSRKWGLCDQLPKDKWCFYGDALAPPCFSLLRRDCSFTFAWEFKGNLNSPVVLQFQSCQSLWPEVEAQGFSLSDSLTWEQVVLKSGLRLRPPILSF